MSSPSRRLVASPVGSLGLEVRNGQLTLLHLDPPEDFLVDTTADDRTVGDPVLDRVQTQLDEYFAGARTQFDLPLGGAGTPFRRVVWSALQEIPYGTTMSYGAVARRVGVPTGAQAVGAACGSNPIAIVVPCHRVLGADGLLIGFAGGLERKRDLLAWEQRESLLF
jgi:methylated-DNA-[protein]-cysteine S-methyltransferase